MHSSHFSSGSLLRNWPVKIAGDAVHSGQLLATQARDNTKVENTKTAKKLSYKLQRELDSLPEKIEGIELMRALEIGLKIKTIALKGNSFSVDIKEDLKKAKKFMKKDKLFKLYSFFNDLFSILP